MLEIGIFIGAKYNDGGALEAQVALHGTNASCTPGLAYSQFGFKGRPRSADPPDSDGSYSNGGLCLYWYEGSTLHTIPLDDGRRSTKLPQLDEGGAIFYCDVDNAFAIWRGDGTLDIKTPTKVNIGDDPVALALASALKAILDAANAATPGNQEPGFLAFKQALALITDYATKALMGT